MEKKTKIILIIVGATIFLALLGFWIYNRYFVEQMLEITSPKGGEVFQAGKTYQITWDARNIGNIGIMLVKGRDQKEIKVIASDIPASKRKFDYSVFVWENAGEDYDQDYKIAIYEYPWQEGKKISYSTDYFTIAGPKFASCDTLSKNNEWPYLPSDYPELKKVFVTQGSYNGNLEGLEGADRKCQDEAEKLDYGGTWKAFLGDDQKLATDRLNLEGIFIDAKAETVIDAAGKTVDVFKDIGVGRPNGYDVFSYDIVVNPKEAVSLVLKYDLAENLNVTKDKSSYSLYVQKQPGTDADPFNFTFVPPFGTEIVKASKELDILNNMITNTLGLRRDVNYFIELR